MTSPLVIGELKRDAPHRVLVISPHGDDEVYGCGGLIASLAAQGVGVEVIYVAVGGIKHRHLTSEATTDARMKEIAAACEALGVQKWRILFPGMDMRMDTVPQLEIVSLLDAAIEEAGHREVYYPYPSHNHDHQAVHRACSAALRPGAHRGITMMAMYEYVYPGWCNVTAPGGRMYVDITATLETKCRALACYTSQVKPPPSPLSINGVRTIAAMRGLEAGVAAAELFHVQQMLR